MYKCGGTMCIMATIIFNSSSSKNTFCFPDCNANQGLHLIFPPFMMLKEALKERRFSCDYMHRILRS